MQTSRTYLLIIFLICGIGSLLLSCGNWEVPTKKTKRECITPSGSLTQKAQERKVDFSISDAKGTIDQIIWNFGNGSATVTTTGTTVTYTYPIAGTYTATATMTNTCGDKPTSSAVVTVFNIVLPSVSIIKPSSTGVTTASVNFVVSTYGNPAAVEYGICYSSSINTPETKNSTAVAVTTPGVGVTTAVNLPNLTPSTTYYYRAYAKLPSGDTNPVYSSTVETFTTQADPLLQDLVASVSFTDQSLLDISGYSNHVKLVGSPTFTTDRKGKASAAILLNGSGDYFFMPENSNNSLNPEALSISIWIRPAPLTNGRMQIYNKSTFSTGDNEMYSSMLKPENDTGPNTTILTDIKQLSNCKQGEGWQSFAVTNGMPLNTWHHLVFTYSGRSVRMYLDGTLQYSPDNLPANSMDKCVNGDLKFGAQYKGLPWYFKGGMDDIRIYKRALTASEVDALYKQ